MPEITEEKFRQLKRDVEEAKASAERAKGALGSLMERLKTEYECPDLKAAKVLLEKLERRKAKASQEFSSALKEYEEKWHD